jgi:hypothetical protein
MWFICPVLVAKISCQQPNGNDWSDPSDDKSGHCPEQAQAAILSSLRAYHETETRAVKKFPDFSNIVI